MLNYRRILLLQYRVIGIPTVPYQYSTGWGYSTRRTVEYPSQCILYPGQYGYMSGYWVGVLLHLLSNGTRYIAYCTLLDLVLI